MDFFEEIAKYRALRRMWARLMRDRFGATDPRSMMLRTHTQTAGSTLTLQQPENNIVRAAVQALAAALGGVQSMALSCFDEAIAIPTQRAQTLAVRTQQMLQHEFGITDVADPLGGSWYVERADRPAGGRRAGADGRDRAAGRRRGRHRAGLLPAADRRRGVRKQRRLADGEDVVVGVNAFAEDGAPAPERFDVPPQLERRSRTSWQRCGRRGTQPRWSARWHVGRRRAAAPPT